MCAICVDAQDATPPTGEGATADAWEKTSRAYAAWVAAQPDDSDLHTLSEEDKMVAWAEHMDATTVDRAIN